MEIISWSEYKARCTDKKGFTLTHYSKLFNAAHCRVNIEDLDFQLGYDDRYSTKEWNNQVNQFKKAHLENFVEITAEVAEEIKNTLSAYEDELATVKAHLSTGLSGFEYNGAIAKKAHLEMMVAKYTRMVELLPTFAADEDEKTGYVMTKLETNKFYYFGDVNPEHGGVVCRKLENGSIEAFEINEFSPINFCNFVCRLIVNEDYKTLDQVEDAFYNGEMPMESYTDFKFMKSIDWEYTNESNKDTIDKFVRYDYNIWNLIKRYIDVPLNTKIIGA